MILTQRHQVTKGRFFVLGREKKFDLVSFVPLCETNPVSQ